VLVAPFIRPANKVGDTPPLPYYLYCLIGIAVIVFGVLYWAIWRLALPYVFKFRLVPRKEVLEDGTVVTLVSQLTGFCMGMFSVGRPGLTEGSVFPGEGDKEYGKVMRDARDEELFCKWIILGIATDSIRF
jgi:H+/Cl- antiporter ClcA